MSSPLALVTEALEDPNLSMERASVEMLRLTMHQHMTENKVFSPGAAAAIIEGMAKLKQVGGAQDLKEVLQSFMYGGGEEEVPELPDFVEEE